MSEILTDYFAELSDSFQKEKISHLNSKGMRIIFEAFNNDQIIKFDTSKESISNNTFNSQFSKKVLPKKSQN